MRATIAFLAVVGFTIVYSVEGNHEFKCLGKKLHFTDTQKENMKTCHKEWKDRHADATDKDHAWQEPCFLACKFGKAGLVKDGKFDGEAAKKDTAAMLADIPSENLDTIKKGIDDCVSKHTEKLSTDDKCKSYDNLGKCLLKNMWTNCKDKED